MREEEINSEAVILGEDESCPILEPFTIKAYQEKEEKRKKARDTWKRKYRKWKAVEKIAKSAWEKKNKAIIQRLKKIEKEAKTEEEIKKAEKSLVLQRLKYYEGTTPPFPGSEVEVSYLINEIAAGEYIDKVYDAERLAELTEMSQRLKSSIVVYATNSVKLGIAYRPPYGKEVSELSEEESEKYKEQGIELVKWYHSRVEKGKAFSEVAYEVIHSKAGIGEGYFEIIDDNSGNIGQIKSASPIYIYEGKDRDRYLWADGGVKKYFKKFNDKKVRRASDFKAGATKLADRATRLLPYKEFNLVSDVYGCPVWTGAIPQVIGSRYAAESNVNFFSNNSVPRMAVLVMGGALDVHTEENIKKFFRGVKGRQNSGRVLVLAVSSKNQLSPDSKPPIVKLEPLTVGKTDDGSFMKYQAGSEETIREAFRQALTFYGTSGDSNRASSYTLRDQTVEMVYKPESETLAFLCNDTFTNEWAIKKGYRKYSATGELIKDDLLAEIYFLSPRTMSEKDAKEIQIGELTAGALTINDYRAMNGLERINRWWAELSKPLLVPAIQMSALAPEIIATLTPYDEFSGGDAAQETDDSDTGAIDEEVDDTVKALVTIREAMSDVLKKHNHEIDPVILKRLDMLYKLNEIMKETNEKSSEESE